MEQKIFSRRYFPEDFFQANYLFRMKKTDCDNDVDNDLVNFDDDNGDFDIADDEKEFSDED